jgi:hypothetical protein
MPYSAVVDSKCERLLLEIMLKFLSFFWLKILTSQALGLDFMPRYIKHSTITLISPDSGSNQHVFLVAS